jgi:hypothetical protein
MKRQKKRVALTGVLSEPLLLSDPREEKADWIEFWTLISSDKNTSFSEIRSKLKFGGSADAASENDGTEPSDSAGSSEDNEISEDTNLYEAAAEETFFEISDRIKSCGEPSYPFEVDAENIRASGSSLSSVYAFLLLLSKYGPGAGINKNDGAKLFEEISSHALKSFLGGDEAITSSMVFGFPRRITCDGFADALDRVCGHLEEGEGHKDRPTTENQKDAKLDLLAWKSFNDKRKGRLIVFGQCAAGTDWKDKRTELPPTEAWCGFWMKDRPAVLPLRAFFVPFRVSEKDWFHTCVFGGLLFDRCRITSHTTTLPTTLLSEITAWSQHVLNCRRGN